MKKLLLLFIFLPILSIAQVATVTISIPSNLDLETIARPNNTVSPVYLTARTYLNGGPSNGDNGIPENRFYTMVNGTATGGVSGMDSYTLAQQLAKKYIIQRGGFYFTTLKTLIHIDNVLDTQDSIAKWYGLVKGISVKGRIDSVKTALPTYTKSTRTAADSVRLNSEISRAGNKENSLSTRIVNDSTALKTETARAIAVEATKEAVIAATSAADYFRGDKSMQNFVNASRASNTAGTGISYINGVIANTSPDQTVTIASGNKISVTGTYPSFTVAVNKRQETYSGTTIAAGTYTVSFGTVYGVAPNIQANIINATDTQNIRITSISTTGFTVLVRNRTDVIGLLPSYANVSGATVDVLITEK